MFTSDLNYDYPEKLVAKEPRADFRTAYIDLTGDPSDPQEIDKNRIFNCFKPGDVLVLNDTKVLQRRVTALNGLEILFLDRCSDEGEVSANTGKPQASALSTERWQVLCPAREIKDREIFFLPGPQEQSKIAAQLVSRGLPQTLEVSQKLTDEYFLEVGELALPPYIQKARGERRNRSQDREWYQTAWAKHAGSFAAPTASLHFTAQDLLELKNRGVHVAHITLHVGLGTFLPIKTARLDEHQMHSEHVFIAKETADLITQTKKSATGRVWALGTTVTRALESWAQGRLSEVTAGFSGATDLFIRPGFQFKMVDGLLTNFHQPGSSLIALVSAFAGGHERVLSTYKWAIDKNFRLFSYGDLTIWVRK